MAAQSDNWKQRYQLAREEQRRQSGEHRELVEQLARALARVSLACNGIDATLDSELAGLRGFLRPGCTVSAAALASKIDLIDQRLLALDADRERHASAAGVRLDRLLERLHDTRPSRELGLRIGAFRRDAAQRLRAEHTLDDVLFDCAELQAEVLQAMRSGEPEPLTLGQRLFGRRQNGETRGRGNEAALPAPQSEPATKTNVAVDREPMFESVRIPASSALAALTDTVEAPAAEARHRNTYEAIKARLARGVRLGELVPSIHEIRVLAAAALARNQDEFGAFLQQLNEQLSAAGAAVSGARDLAEQRAGVNAGLNSALQHGVDTMRNCIASASCLEQLKQEVTERIAHMTGALDECQARDLQLQQAFDGQIAALEQRVRHLDERSLAAEARIAEQRRLAVTDRLTQLPNREAYELRLLEEFERWKRYGRALSFAICDIDCFKQVNDRHGHAAGDQVISAVARTLREHLRESDFVARYGGEEFAILLIETDTTRGARALEILRAALEALRVAHGGQSIGITGSFGMATFLQGDTRERVFARADAALYQAKSDGRNRVCVYGAVAAQPGG